MFCLSFFHHHLQPPENPPIAAIQTVIVHTIYFIFLSVLMVIVSIGNQRWYQRVRKNKKFLKYHGYFYKITNIFVCE